MRCLLPPELRQPRSLWPSETCLQTLGFTAPLPQPPVSSMTKSISGLGLVECAQESFRWLQLQKRVQDHSLVTMVQSQQGTALLSPTQDALES